MMGKFLIVLIIFLGFKFIPKFLKKHKMHRPIAKYFDFLFISNLPLFFILLAIFCWGMYLAHIDNQYDSYFILSFNYKDVLFFVGFTLFIFGINIKTRLDNLIILDGWNVEEAHYKTNLNHLYTSPNFVSCSSAMFFSRIYSLIGSVLILILEPLCFLLLIIYYLLNFYLNKKIIQTESFRIFLIRCFFNFFILFVLFSAGWLYYGGHNILKLFNYSFMFFTAVFPIILIYEILSFQNLSSEEYSNRKFIINNKKVISFTALIMLVISFILSFFIFDDPLISHFSIITIPFILYAFLRSQKKDFIRSFTYPVMIINILLSWTFFPLLFIAQLIIYYLSKYYFWHRFDAHFPTFLVEDSE